MGRQSKLKAARRIARSQNVGQVGQVHLDPSIPRPPPPVSNKPRKNDPNDLFDNPMVRAAMAALSDEDKERYRIIGEQLYGTINFEDGQALNNMPPSMVEAVAYLETQLQSGLHPSMLEDNEKTLLADAYGDEWYTEWGYVKDDLDDIVTLMPTLKTHNEENKDMSGESEKSLAKE